MELYLKGGGNLDLPPLHQQSHPLQSFNPANWKCQTHANILSLPRLGQWCGNKNCVMCIDDGAVDDEELPPATDTVPVITSEQQVSAIPCQSSWQRFVS